MTQSSSNQQEQDQNSIKLLPLKLRKNGFNYTQVIRGQKAAIYAQEVTKGITYFEVFLLKVKSKREIEIDNTIKTVDASERFPNDEAFGYWAWSFRTHDKAKAKFEELEEN